jgi:peptide/nickel transport system permease protein
MPFAPVVLVSDALVWGLALAGGVALVRARRAAYLRAAWTRLTRSAVALGSLVLLLAYGAVALADSVHFHRALPGGGWATELDSVLDLALAPLRARSERTYSAPLALYGHARETVTRPDGTLAREYPRLVHAAPGLADADHLRDVLSRTALGLGAGAVLWAGLAGLVAGRCRRAGGLRAVLAGHTPVAWRGVLAAVGLLALLLGVGIALAGNYHVLGTDKVGQDVLYLALKSIRTGFLIGVLTLAILTPVAIVLGLAAGYFGGWLDDAIQYLYTTLSSIPGVLLIAAAVLSLDLYLDNAAAEAGLAQRADLRLLALCAILGATGWIGLCRLLRGETLKLRELEYVQAARALGVPPLATLRRHLLPGVVHIVLITAVIEFSALVLAEAVLAYVGVGVDPSMISWGNMINSARLELAREPPVWWSLAAAFVFMLGLVLPANLYADAVRDALDPRLRAA